MTSVFFIFKSSFSLMLFGYSIAFSSGGMILWGRSACSPSITTSALLSSFCCGFLSFSIFFDTSFLSWCIWRRVIHAPRMFSWVFAFFIITLCWTQILNKRTILCSTKKKKKGKRLHYLRWVNSLLKHGNITNRA